MKRLILIIFTLVASQLLDAQKYLTKQGEIHFEASVPMFEDVDAKNSDAVCLFNTDTGGFATIAVVKNFKFSVGLMEEHFNENYAESAKYPKASFSGVVKGFDKSQLSSTAKKYIISGTLNFHGVDNKVDSPATIVLQGGKIHVMGSFVAKPTDYKVKIPKMVTKKIAETVKVNYHFTLEKQ